MSLIKKSYIRRKSPNNGLRSTDTFFLLSFTGHDEIKVHVSNNQMTKLFAVNHEHTSNILVIGIIRVCLYKAPVLLVDIHVAGLIGA